MLYGLSKNSTIHILDRNGKAVRSMPLQNQDKVEVNGLTTGRYLVQPAKDKSIMQKIIIQ